MTWSERFSAYLKKRGLNQLDAVLSLRDSGIRATPSQIHYWRNGAVPREETQALIAAWSKGAVPAIHTRRTG